MIKTRVLIADDHAIVRMGLTSLFSAKPDFEVVGQAKNGEIAIRDAKRLSPDVVVMDLMMPEMNGYEATKAIRALEDREKASLPIIAMTANAFEEDRKNALEAGMDGHLAKPIDVNQLVECLTEGFKKPHCFA